MWSRGGSYLWPGPTALGDSPPGGRSLAVVSPDSSVTINVRDDQLIVSGPSIQPGPMHEIESLSEILWAPDSKAFALTSSDGGSVGTWSVRVYWPADGNVTDPSKVALRTFKREFWKCPEEYPNVGAIGWVQASRRLRVLVEMPCHSSCIQMCRLRGYVVDAMTGQVVERLSEDAVGRRWKGSLGERFSAYAAPKAR